MSEWNVRFQSSVDKIKRALLFRSAWDRVPSDDRGGGGGGVGKNGSLGDLQDHLSLSNDEYDYLMLEERHSSTPQSGELKSEPEAEELENMPPTNRTAVKDTSMPLAHKSPRIQKLVDDETPLIEL